MMRTKEEMKKRFWMALPILVYPFLTLLLWSFGMFRPNEAVAAIPTKGLNTAVPEANLKTATPQDKLGFYSQADKDSIRLKEQLANDPYYKDIQAQGMAMPVAETPAANVTNKYTNANEAKIYERIGKLQEAMKEPPAVVKSNDAGTANVKVDNGSVDRLEQLMQKMQAGNGTDPQMQELNGMMDKVLDMQHPERVSERMRAASLKKKGQVFPLAAPGVRSMNSTVLGGDSSRKIRSVGFFGLEEINVADSVSHPVVATVQETQTVVSGSTVKLRLADEVMIGGVVVAKNSFVFGTASVNGERLEILIPSLQYRDQLLPVSLEVYDVDGLRGIHIPGSINRDVAKESSNQAIGSIGVGSLDGSVAAQATNAGIQAAKSLLSKKTKLVKVMLKAGYKVLLKDNNQQQF